VDEHGTAIPDEETPPRFVPVRDFRAMLARLGIQKSRATVYREIARRIIPHIRSGARGTISVDWAGALRRYGIGTTASADGIAL
jgi:hypothetical protein